MLPTPENKEPGTPPVHKPSRPRYNSFSTGKFEGIDEENEDVPDSPKQSDSNSKTEEVSGTLAENEKDKKTQFVPEEHQTKNRIIHEMEPEQEREQEKHKPILKHSNSLEPPFLETHQSLSRDKNEDNSEPPHDPVDSYYAKNYYTVTGATGGEAYRKLPKSKPSRAVSIAESGRTSFKSFRPTMPGQMISKREFRKSLYWLTYSSKRFGLRHIGFILLVLAYSFAGATFFYIVESRNEQETIASRKILLEEAMSNLAGEITTLVNDPLRNTSSDVMKDQMKSAYIKMLNLEGAYRWTTYFKMEDPDNNFKWTWGSSLFFCMNVYTATGYGSIAPETLFAQYMVMLYGIITIPMTLVVLRSMGQLFLVFFTTVYARILVRLRQVRGYPDTKDDEIISLPLKFAIMIALGYWLICSYFIFEYDRLTGPPGTGIDFFGSVYFSFISLSTIGLGDVMPNNVQFKPIITIIFFLGIPLIKVVNRATYLAIENGIFALFAVMENKLAAMLGGSQQVEPEMGGLSRMPSITSDRLRSVSTVQHDAEAPMDEQESPNEWANNFTIRSIATFMRSNSDVYGGGYGRVDLRRADLLPSNNQTTVQSMR